MTYLATLESDRVLATKHFELTPPVVLWNLLPIGLPAKPIETHPHFHALTERLEELTKKVSDLRRGVGGAGGGGSIKRPVEDLTSLSLDLYNEDGAMRSHFSSRVRALAQDLISILMPLQADAAVSAQINTIKDVERDLAPRVVSAPPAPSKLQKTDVAPITRLVLLTDVPDGIKDDLEAMATHKGVIATLIEDLPPHLQSWIFFEVGKQAGKATHSEKENYGREHVVDNLDHTKKALQAVVAGIDFLNEKLTQADKLLELPFPTPEQMRNLMEGFGDYFDYLDAMSEYALMQARVRSLISKMDIRDQRNIAKDIAYLNGHKGDVEWGQEHLVESLRALESSITYIAAERYSSDDAREDLEAMILGHKRSLRDRDVGSYERYVGPPIRV